MHSPNHSIDNAIICRCTQKHNHSVLHKTVLMSVLHTKPYEITKFSDICNFIYSLNQSHSRSITFLFTRSPSHNSHQLHNLSHSPNPSINDAIIRRCTQTHNHSVLHENVLRSVIHTRPYEITKFSDICDSIYSLNQSHTHAYTHTHSLTHPHKNHKSTSHITN